MISFPYLLKGYVGPFMTGGLMAAAVSVSDPVAVVFLFALAAGCAFLSTPGSEGFIRRALRAAK